MNTMKPNSNSIARLLRPGMLAWMLLFTGTSACVTENTTTGEMVPRGNQRYPWDKVKELAKRLKKGLNKSQVLWTMGTSAEVDEENGLWIYLPERYGILIPAEALRLEFKDGALVDFGYRPIVLGTRL